MALPPDPLGEVLPKAHGCVLGEVVRVLLQDPREPEPVDAPQGAADLPTHAPRQVVALEVKDVVFGDVARKGEVIQVEKPRGAYALRPGNHGPFLLQRAKKDAPLAILGRYGPDTYPIELIRAKVEAAR